MKKTLLSVFAIGCATTAAFAAVGDTFTTSDGIEYKITSETTCELSHVPTSITGELILTLTVANEGTTYTLEGIGERACYYTKFTSLTLPESVRYIGYCGIYNCDLAQITLNEGLEEIGTYGLSYTKISTIKLPSTLTKIGDSGF